MSSHGIIHIIDDEPIIHDVLGQLLLAEGYEVESSFTGEEGLAKLPELQPDVTLLDLLMPGLDGIEVLKRIKARDARATVIIITAYGSVDTAISALKMGALDYVQKPFKNDELLLTIQRAIESRHLYEENARLKNELRKAFSFSNIIGKSEIMQKVFELIKVAAPTRSTILIQGESGTGKELVARAIHQNSNRSGLPFVVVNSGSLPPDLLESHLFGHVKGAFTGAVALKKGLFEAADNGTIFFDEISSLNIETQAKLLRVMQEKEFMRLGGTEVIKVDVRIIAATNTDLEELIAQKKFRNDLFYRLNVIKIELPPLRLRKEDIPLLVKRFIENYNKENGKNIEGVSDEVLQMMDAYDWPGNVRELENVIERAVVLCQKAVIGRDQLPMSFTSGRPAGEESFSWRGGSLDLKERTQEFQRALILSALKKTDGVQSRAAKMLGVKATTLNEMIKRLKLGSDSIQD